MGWEVAHRHTRKGLLQWQCAGALSMLQGGTQHNLCQVEQAPYYDRAATLNVPCASTLPPGQMSTPKC
jgi:hypothetical protein